MAGAPRGREPDDAGDGIAEPTVPIERPSPTGRPGPTGRRGPAPTQRPRTPVTERARAAAEAAAPPEPKRRDHDKSRERKKARDPDKVGDREQRVRDRTTRQLGTPGDHGKVSTPRAIDERTVTLRTAVPGGWPAASRRYRVKILLRDLDRRVLPPAAGLFTRFTRSGLRSRRIAAALAAVAVVAGVVLAVYTATRPPPRIERTEPTVLVGVRAGGWIPDYVAQRRAALRAMIADPRATAGVYALVSFQTYLDPAQVTALFDEVRVAEVFLRARLPAGPTKVVQAPANSLPDDLDQAMKGQAATYTTIADDLGTLIGMASGDTVDDAALRDKYEAARKLAEEEATAYRSLCECVFAAVVFAPPATLGRLADRPQVRVVDAFNRNQAPDPSTYAPPVPEQTGVASPPPVEDGTSP